MPSATSSPGVRRSATPTTTGEDNAIAILRFDDDRTATIEASWTCQGRPRGPQRDLLRARPDHPRHGHHAHPRFLEQPGRLSRREDRCRYRLGLSRSPTSRASPATTRLPPLPRRVPRRHRAARDVRGRLHCQHHPRCRLPLHPERPLGTGRDRRRHHTQGGEANESHRQPHAGAKFNDEAGHVGTPHRTRRTQGDPKESHHEPECS